MRQIYRRTPTPTPTALQLYWNRTSAWVFSCKFVAYFQNTFSKDHLWTAASEARNFIQFFCELKKCSLVENAQQHSGWNYFTPNHLKHFKQTLNFVSLTAFCKPLCCFTIEYFEEVVLCTLLIWHEILCKLRELHKTF